MLTTKCGFIDAPGIPGADSLEFHGPTLFVDIGFDTNYNQGSSGAPTLAATKLCALVDTGATESCIDNSLAIQLALPIINRRKISGSSGAHEVNVYLAHIHVPTLAFTINGAFAGVDLIAGGQRHYALIGRTFLKHFTMVYNGTTGDVTLSK